MNDDYVLVINRIDKLLMQWCYLVQLKNSNSQFDINRISEDVVKELLNCLGMGHFRNCNDEEKNAKGIDLIDDEQSLGIQVTSDQSLAKIRNTLNKSNDNVKKVKMFYLSAKLDNHKYKSLESSYSFNHKTDISILSDIFKYAKNKNKEKEIFSILNKYFGDNYNNIQSTKLEDKNINHTAIEMTPKEDGIDVSINDNYGISKGVIKQFDNCEGYLYNRLFGENQMNSDDIINNAMFKIIDWIIGKISFPDDEITELYNCFDDSLLKTNQRILKSRRNALIAFFSGDINKSKNIYNRLFSQVDLINEKWIRDDILIDGRNIIYRVESNYNSFLKNKYYDKIKELDFNIQYPIIDRIEKDTINNVISKSIDYEYKSRYTEMYGIGLEEALQNIQKIIYNAILYGSITQLNAIRGTLARILIIYANATKDKYICELALKFFVLCNDYKKFKSIANKKSLDNRDIESEGYVKEILNLRKSKLAYDLDYFDIFTFEFYGRLMNNRDFSINENRILKILNGRNIPRINSALKAIPSNIVRLNKIYELLYTLKTLVERGCGHQIQDVLQYIEYNELNKECKILLKEIISIILKRKDYIIIYDLLLDIKEIDKTNEYDEILYNSKNEYIINKLNCNNEFSVDNLELIINKLAERNKATILTGTITGYANDYIISSTFFEKDSKKLREIIDLQLFPLAQKSLVSKKITYNEKIKLLRALMYVYYLDNKYIDKIKIIIDNLELTSSDDMFNGEIDEKYLEIYADYFNYEFKIISLNKLLKKYIIISNNSRVFEEIRIILNMIFTKEKVNECCFDILSILISNMLESNYEENRVNAIRLSQVLYINGYFDDIYDKLYSISISAKYNEMREIVILLNKLPKDDIKVAKLSNNIINNANYNIRYMGNKYL